MHLDGLENAFYILSTGKYLNNWGAYGSCVDSADGDFWMASVTGDVPQTGYSEFDAPDATFRTGLCVPSGCNETDLRVLDSIFVQSAEFNSMMNPQVSYTNMNEYYSENGGITSGTLYFIGAVVVAGILLGVFLLVRWWFNK